MVLGLGTKEDRPLLEHLDLPLSPGVGERTIGIIEGFERRVVLLRWEDLVCRVG